MNKEALTIELVHSLFWMNLTREESYKFRREINNLKFAPDLDVPNKTSFSIESNDANPEPHEKLFRDIQATGICTVANTDYEHRARVQVHFDDLNLKSSLKRAGIVSFVATDKTVAIFLEEAANFHRNFESSNGGQSALAALPIGKEWFSAPRHFVAAVTALSNAGYCECNGAQFRWSQSAEPHMEAAKLWIGEKSADQVREEELIRIWETMPTKFKDHLLSLAKESDGFDVVSLSMVIGHFWYDGKWHDAPEYPDSLKRGDLPGGYIGAAKELDKLLQVGKIKA